MKKEIDIIGRSKIWLGISTILIIASVISIAVFGLNMGIDFTGGSLIELDLGQSFEVAEMRGSLEDLGYDAKVQVSGETGVLIRLGTITQVEYDVIVSALGEQYTEIDELRFESVGPIIGEELKRKSAIAIVLLSVLIMVYVAWTFRKVSKPVASWKYGLLTIVAAGHDVIIPLGVFAILGTAFGYQIDTAFVAALLTIMGYSINDTIVVFDRTRENLVSNRHSDSSFGEIVNKSVLQSFGRSINTSLTTLFVLLAIFFFGGATTQPFVLALVIGIISGAYSSIFVASPLLVMWNRNKK